MNNIFSVLKDIFLIIKDSVSFLVVEVVYFLFNKKLNEKNQFKNNIKDKNQNDIYDVNTYDIHKDIDLTIDASRNVKHLEEMVNDLTFPLPNNKDVDGTVEQTQSHKKFKLYVFICIFFISIFLYTIWDLPSYKKLINYQPPLTTVVYSADNYIISEFAKEKRLFVPLNRISPFVVDAFLSAEDKNFFNHMGFDYLGLMRASYKNFLYYLGLSKNIEGASTITQQVVKNFLLNNDRTFKRKIREAILTIEVETNFDKNYILELYLNEIYLGRSSYGVSMASLNYFGKPISDLSLAEAALLATLPKAPSKYDPSVNYDGAKARRDWVIMRMLEDKKITKEQAQDAIDSDIVLQNRLNIKTLKTQYASEEIRKTVIKDFGYDSIYNSGLVVKTTINYKYQEYAYDALQRGIIAYDQKNGYRGVYNENTQYQDKDIKEIQADKKPLWKSVLNQSLYVSPLKLLPLSAAIILDVKPNVLEIGLMEGSTEKILLQNNMWVLSKNKQSIYNSFNDIFKKSQTILVEEKNGNFFIRQIPEINGALIAMDPQSGDILAMQGGYSFAMSEFNRSIQALRQPGSAIKPFIYLSAIDKGYKPTDLILDAPYVVENEDDKSWRPKNYLNSYRGFVTLRNALEYSRNLVTIRVANDVGLDRINNLFKKLNIYKDDITDLTGSLGSKEVTLLNLVRAYASLANGGKIVNPRILQYVQDRNGKVIFKADNRDCTKCKNIPWQNQEPPEIEDLRLQALNSQSVYIIVNLLQGVVERGSGKYAKIKDFNIAGKTGTTNDVKDAWFIGFTPDLLVGVYIGADDPKSLGGETESATSLSVPVFRYFMMKALQSKVPLPFKTPEGIVSRWVNYSTGKLDSPSNKNVILESFKEGNIQEQEHSSKDNKSVNNGDMDNKVDSYKENNTEEEGLY